MQVRSARGLAVLAALWLAAAALFGLARAGDEAARASAARQRAAQTQFLRALRSLEALRDRHAQAEALLERLARGESSPAELAARQRERGSALEAALRSLRKARTFAAAEPRSEASRGLQQRAKRIRSGFAALEPHYDRLATLPPDSAEFAAGVRRLRRHEQVFAGSLDALIEATRFAGEEAARSQREGAGGHGPPALGIAAGLCALLASIGSLRWAWRRRPVARRIAAGILRDALEPASLPGLWSQRCARIAALGVGLWIAHHAWLRRRWLYAIGTDSWVHLAYIRRSIGEGLFPSDPFYAGFPTGPFYSLMHPLYAGICELTGIRAHECWPASSGILAALAIAFTYLWVRELARDERIAALSAAAVLIAGDSSRWWTMPTPFSIALIPSALALYCFARSLRDGRRSLAIAAGLLVGAAFDFHPLRGGIGALWLAALALAARRGLASLLWAGVAAALVSAPWALNFIARWLERGEPVAGFFTTFPEVAVWDPGIIAWRTMSLAFLGSLLTRPLWWLVAVGALRSAVRVRSGSASLAERYALVSALVGAVLLLTPAYELLLRVGGVWCVRLVQTLHLPLLIGVGGAACFDGLRRFGVAGFALACALLGASAVSLGPGLRAQAAMLDYFSSVDVGPGGPLGDWDVEAKLARSGPRPRVVLADAVVSYALPYYLGSHVVVIPVEHRSPYIDDRERVADVERFFDPATPDAELRAILARYGVDVVVADLRAVRSDPANQRLDARLRASPDFEATGCCGEFAFHRYRGAAAP